MPTVLESLLDPISRVDFREQFYGRKPLLIRGHPSKFAGLFSWDELNRLLNGLSYPHDQVVTARGKNALATASPDALLERCREGASVIVSRINELDPRIGGFTRSLAAEIGEPLNVNLYLSQPTASAFDVHYDRHDVFILHVYGRKQWWLYGQTAEKPIFQMMEEHEEPPREPTFECELAPGDVLYVPRGEWHRALAQDGLSVHLTLGVNARTGIDFLTWLVNELRGDARVRHELPLTFADEPAAVREERLRQYVASLEETVVSRLRDAETVRSFHGHCVVAERDFARFKLPAQLLDTPATELAVKRFSRPAHQRVLLDDEPADDTIALTVWGNVFHFPKSARPLVELIVSRTEFSIDDALANAGELTEEGVLEVLDPLLREGILDAPDLGR